MKKQWNSPKLLTIGNGNINTGTVYYPAPEIIFSCSADLDTTGPNSGYCNFVYINTTTPVASFTSGSTTSGCGIAGTGLVIANSSAFACS